MKVWKPKTSYAARGDGTWETLLSEIAALGDKAAVDAWRYEFTVRGHRDLPEVWQEAIFDACDERLVAILHSDMDAMFSATVGRPH